MNWIENLPEKCPPDESFEPEKLKVYRLATVDTPDEVDFQSQRAIKPNAKFKGVDECITRSLSVYDEVQKCLNMVKLPAYKNRWKAVLELELNNVDGLVMKTFKDKNHYSWWRTSNFDISSSIVKTNE